MSSLGSFEFATAARVVFGAGKWRELGSLARELGHAALLVTGRNPQRAESAMALLARHGLTVTPFTVTHEPSVETVRQGVSLARQQQCDLVIGFGGGSVLDAGKAIAAMLTNEGELLDYLEVIGRGKTLLKPAAPYLAVPTTAGTGTEVTRNAVLGSPGHGVKVSLRSPLMLARVALVDPELTYDLPPALTASTGLDALTQLIEPFVSLRSNPMTDALCVEGMCRAARSLRSAFACGHDPSAREDMAVASLFGGFALANAGLGAVHGFAGPIGGAFPAPHGAACAALLHYVMEANLGALRRRQPTHPALERYDQVAKLLTSDSTAKADAGVCWVRQLVLDLGIPRLGQYGITPADTAGLVEKALHASSLKANPIALTREELARILEQAI